MIITPSPQFTSAIHWGLAAGLIQFPPPPDAVRPRAKRGTRDERERCRRLMRRMRLRRQQAGLTTQGTAPIRIKIPS